MQATATAQIERLTDELRQLVGRGVWTMRLVTLPTLREASRVDGSLTVQGQASAIRRYIEATIQSMDGAPYAVRDVKVEAATMRRALRLLLKFEGTGQDARERRGRVLTATGIKFPVDQMRRPNSPERELLGILAEV